MAEAHRLQGTTRLFANFQWVPQVTLVFKSEAPSKFRTHRNWMIEDRFRQKNARLTCTNFQRVPSNGIQLRLFEFWTLKWMEWCIEDSFRRQTPSVLLDRSSEPTQFADRENIVLLDRISDRVWKNVSVQASRWQTSKRLLLHWLSRFIPHQVYEFHGGRKEGYR